jgi:hypothetical protein
MLEMVPGNAGISPVAGADGPGDHILAEREKRRDPLSRTEILCQVEAHAKEKTPKEKRSLRSVCRVCKHDGDEQDQAGASANKEDAGEGMGEALVGRVHDWAAEACVDPAQDNGTELPGKPDHKPCQCKGAELFWPGHMDIRQDGTTPGAGADNNDKKGSGENKRTAGNEGAEQCKYDMVPGNHLVTSYLWELHPEAGFFYATFAARLPVHSVLRETEDGEPAEVPGKLSRCSPIYVLGIYLFAR